MGSDRNGCLAYRDGKWSIAKEMKYRRSEREKKGPQ
jgi:hypothetical protein